MSAIGTKRTWASALQMSAFGGKADITIKGLTALRRPISKIAARVIFDP
jgi:hypothetical protein